MFVGPQLWLGESSSPWRPSWPRSWTTPPGRTARLPHPCGGCAPPRAPQTGCPQRGRRRRSVGRPWSPGQTLRTCTHTHTNTHDEKETDGREEGGRPAAGGEKKKSQRNPNIDKSPLMGPRRRTCIRLSWKTVDVFTDAPAVRLLDKHFRQTWKTDQSSMACWGRQPTSASGSSSSFFFLLDGSAKLSYKICHPNKPVEARINILSQRWVTQEYPKVRLWLKIEFINRVGLLRG